MTSSDSLVVLDVGHGSCTVLSLRGQTVVVDIASYPTLVEYLDDNGIDCVDHLVISHADEDHIIGAAALIFDGRVSAVYVNSDSTKTSKAWTDLRTAVSVATERGDVEFRGLFVKSGPSIEIDGAEIHTLSPGIDDVLSGPGGSRLDGQSINSNSSSVVVRVIVNGEPFALIPGDIDSSGWSKIVELRGDIRSPILVFPHHGGKSSGNDTEFAKSVTEAVEPEVVLFSIGRKRYRTPRPDIIAGIRSASPTVRIACTQLSENCASVMPIIPQDHLSSTVALGKIDGTCCAGTMKFEIPALTGIGADPDPDEHMSYVRQLPSPLCLT